MAPSSCSRSFSCVFSSSGECQQMSMRHERAVWCARRNRWLVLMCCRYYTEMGLANPLCTGHSWMVGDRTCTCTHLRTYLLHGCRYVIRLILQQLWVSTMHMGLHVTSVIEPFWCSRGTCAFSLLYPLAWTHLFFFFFLSFFPLKKA